MKLWMKVSEDEYELPLAVADSAEELSAMTGRTAGSIQAMVSKYKHGKKYCGYWRTVEIEEDDDD